MTCDNQSGIRMTGASGYQVPPAGLFISFAAPPQAQVDSSEVRDLLVRLVELYEQKSAVDADKERLVGEKANLEEELVKLRGDNDGLKAEVRELRKRERVLQRRLKPDTLFFDVLVPMVSAYPALPSQSMTNLTYPRFQLRLDPQPTSVPAVLEIEIRKPCEPEANYAQIETRTYNTVTGEMMKERKRLISKGQKSAALRLTYSG